MNLVLIAFCVVVAALADRPYRVPDQDYFVPKPVQRNRAFFRYIHYEPVATVEYIDSVYPGFRSVNARRRYGFPPIKPEVPLRTRRQVRPIPERKTDQVPVATPPTLPNVFPLQTPPKAVNFGPQTQFPNPNARKESLPQFSFQTDGRLPQNPNAFPPQVPPGATNFGIPPQQFQTGVGVLPQGTNQFPIQAPPTATNFGIQPQAFGNQNFGQEPTRTGLPQNPLEAADKNANVNDAKKPFPLPQPLGFQGARGNFPNQGFVQPATFQRPFSSFNPQFQFPPNQQVSFVPQTLDNRAGHFQPRQPALFSRPFPSRSNIQFGGFIPPQTLASSNRPVAAPDRRQLPFHPEFGYPFFMDKNAFYFRVPQEKLKQFGASGPA